MANYHQISPRTLPFFSVRAVANLRSRYPGIDILLKTWKAHIAKWRFETIAVVFRELLRVRFLAEHFLAEELHLIFPAFQDSELLKDVQDAANWTDLWKFLATWHELMVYPLEHLRRWGLTCECCAPWEPGSAKPRCIHSSRKMHLARDEYYGLQDKVSHPTTSATPPPRPLPTQQKKTQEAKHKL